MIEKALHIIENATRITAFTGAGISVESGIPPFRGPDGLWSRVSPEIFSIQYFMADPRRAWEVLQSGFGDLVDQAKPNAAHRALAHMEKMGKCDVVITQNIDGLHYIAGNSLVYEFHGTAKDLICLQCKTKFPRADISLASLPPRCPDCNGILKPDFVFFGESIPEPTRQRSFDEARKSDCFILVGTSGEVMPACMIPLLAKENGAAIIEVNRDPSNYTPDISDVFLQGKATEQLTRLVEALKG